VGHARQVDRPGDTQAHETYLPGWLPGRRQRAESKLVSGVTTSYLLGVSTRWIEKQAEHTGITG
jgi:hypothetical protein